MTTSHSDTHVTNEAIWREYKQFVNAAAAVAIAPESLQNNTLAAAQTYDEILRNKDGVEIVADILDVNVSRVNAVIDDMLDDDWRNFYLGVIFPLERAWSTENPPLPEEEKRVSYIYIMHYPEANLYKIGQSENPKRRLSEINLGIPPGHERATLNGYVKVPASKVDEAERVLHEALSSRRVEREWFHIGRDEGIDIFGIIKEYWYDATGKRPGARKPNKFKHDNK